MQLLATFINTQHIDGNALCIVPHCLPINDEACWINHNKYLIQISNGSHAIIVTLLGRGALRSHNSGRSHKVDYLEKSEM